MLIFTLSPLWQAQQWWFAGDLLQFSQTAATFVGAAVCFGLRVMNSPVPRLIRDRGSFVFSMPS
jgi:hypothetical protein